MILITGSKKILLDFYFKNNIFSNKNNLDSLYYIKPYFIKNLRETIINYFGIYKLYYSSDASKDKIISYKEDYEHSFYR
jgi:hypothetical protein